MVRKHHKQSTKYSGTSSIEKSRKMGQRLDRNPEVRVEYDENGNNGLVMSGVYIPEELISEILFYIDYKSLLKCQVVCKRWRMLVHEYVWRKKAEKMTGLPLQTIKDMPWDVFYHICNKKPFHRNLLKNHSGDNDLAHWEITCQGGDHWKVEKPPNGVPELPADSVFKENPSCFVTSYYTCTKHQIINLVDEGLPQKLLDKYQPPIEIGEWYSCRWDCPAVYECSISLLGDNNKLLDSFQFRDRMVEENQNQWLHVSHEFKNYGPGLRKVLFQHGGKDIQFWAGHYGSKMARASVIVRVPQDLPVPKDLSPSAPAEESGDEDEQIIISNTYGQHSDYYENLLDDLD